MPHLCGMTLSDRSAPCAGFMTPSFDKFFEVFEIIFDASRHKPKRIARIFHKPFWIIRKLQGHLRTVIAQPGEIDLS